MSSSPPPPPAWPSDWASFCDERNTDIRPAEEAGPCLLGLAWWIWLLLIGGSVCVCCTCAYCCCTNYRRGNTPWNVFRFGEV